MTTQTSFWRAGDRATLVAGVVYLTTTQMVWLLVGALGNYIAGDLGLNAGRTATLVAIPILSGSLLRLLLGPMTDVMGGRKTGLIACALAAIPLLLGWLWAEWLNEIYLVGLLLGFAGATFAVALPMVSFWYPAKHKGLAMGIVGMGNLGTVMAVFFAPRLAELYGWHRVFGLATIPLAAAGVVFFLFAKDAPGSLRKNEVAEYLAVLKEKDAYVFCLFYGVTFGGFVGLASFLSILLRDQYSVSKVTAGDLATVCLVTASVLRPVGGWLADKLGGLRVLMAVYGAAAVLFLGIAQLPPLGTAVILFFAALGCLGIGNGTVFQLVPQRFAAQVGSATGIIGAAGGVGGFLLPILLAKLKATSGSYALGLTVFAAIAGAALVTLLVVQREWVGRWLAAGGRAKTATVLAAVESA